MARGGLRNHFPFMRTMAALLALLALVIGILIHSRQSIDNEGLDRERWQWAPAESFRVAEPPVNGWTRVPDDSGFHPGPDAYWLRIPLDSRSVREPLLWFMNAYAIAVYADGRLLYSYDPDERHHRINLYYHWNLAPLPASVPSEAYVLLDNRGISLPLPWVKLIGKGDLTSYLIHKDFYCFVLASLFLFSFFVAISLYFIRRDKLHLYFGLLGLCGCYASLVRNNLFQLFWDQPWLGYMELAIFPFGVYGFISIMIVLFDNIHTRWLQRLRWINLSFAVATLIFAVFLSPVQFGWLLSYPLLSIFLVTAGFILSAIWSAYKVRNEGESVWMLAGFFVVTATALIHVVRTYFPVFFGWVRQKIPLLDNIPFDVLSLGLFLFLICIIRVIIHRFGAMNEQLQGFNQSLENSVLARSAELHEREYQLREASKRLDRTMRETAEAIASSMVLEERHRVTGTIHDTIGHSLTATIVQLEAAKRLLVRDPRLAENKLEASQGLVRRGLEEIRLSVRLLKHDSSEFDLAGMMKALVKETEQSTGAKIEQRIGEVPGELTVLQRRVLYQALQEGLTNGLRHGRSRRFRFTLDNDGRELTFRLESDGLTYHPSEFGFGLRAMSERVLGLGGDMTVSPGNPGCVLVLTMPYDADRLQAL